MSVPEDGGTITSGSVELTSHREARLVVARFAAGTRLTGEDGVAIVGALESMIGTTGERFALFADAKGVSGTDADYRVVTGKFFEQHRDTARIALINLGPIIRIVAEMFRVAIGLQLRTFADEAAARSWLRTQGIGA